MSGNVSKEMSDWVDQAKKLLDASIKKDGDKPTGGEFRQKMLEGMQMASKPKPNEITDSDWAELQKSSNRIQKKLSSNGQIKKAIQTVIDNPDKTSVPTALWNAVFDFWQEFKALSEDIEKRRQAMAKLVTDLGDPAALLDPSALAQLKQLDDPKVVYSKVKAFEKQRADLEGKLDAKKSAAYVIDVAKMKNDLAAITQSLKRLELGDAKDQLDIVEKEIARAYKEIDDVNTLIKDKGGIEQSRPIATELGVTDLKKPENVFTALRTLKDVQAQHEQATNDLGLAVTYAESVYGDKTNKDTQGKEQKKQQTIQLKKNCEQWLEDWKKLKNADRVGSSGRDLISKVRDRIDTLNQGAPKSSAQVAAEKAARDAKNWSAFRAAVQVSVDAYVANSYLPAERGQFPNDSLPQSVVQRCQEVPQFSIGGRSFFWANSLTTPQVGAMHWEIPNNFWVTGAGGQQIRSFIYHLAPEP
jgi:hypothetical protein